MATSAGPPNVITIRRLTHPADTARFRELRLHALQSSPAAFSADYAVESQRPLEHFAARLDSSFVFGAFHERVALADRATSTSTATDKSVGSDEGASIDLADAGLVGIIGFCQEPGPKVSHKGDITSFFVHRELRGRSIGTQLMEMALETARGCGVQQVMLGVVVGQAGGNNGALRLYERMGFERYGLEKRALNVEGVFLDEILMALFLNT